MDHEKALAVIKSVLSKMPDIYLALPLDSIRPDHLLIEDLSIDSIGRISFYYDLLDTLGHSDDGSEVQSWKSVQDIIDYISKVKT